MKRRKTRNTGDGLTEVYRVPPQQVQAALAVLRRGGLSPVALDDPTPVMQYAARGTYQVRIAVPTEQVEQAGAVLRAWDEKSRASVDPLTSRFKRDVLLGLLIAVATAGLVQWATGSSESVWVWGFLTWIVATAIVGRLGRKGGKG